MKYIVLEKFEPGSGFHQFYVGKSFQNRFQFANCCCCCDRRQRQRETEADDQVPPVQLGGGFQVPGEIWPKLYR